MAAEHPKGSLPYGWIEKVSRKYPDRVYYFNTLTGASIWECPQLDPPRCYENLEGKNVQTNICNSKITTNSEDPKPDFLINDAVLKQKAVPLKSAAKTMDNSLKSNQAPTAVVVPVCHKHHNQNAVQGKKQPAGVKGSLNCQDKSPKKFKRKASSDEYIESSSLPLREQVDFLLKKKKKRKKNKEKNSVKASEPSQENNLEDNVKEPTVLSSSISQSAGTSNKLEETLIEDCPEDVEMLDVSKDLIDDLTTKQETVVDTFASYYIVVDTNIFISELQMIDELKETPLNGCGPPHIFIPWIVVEELDRLKSGKSKFMAQGKSRSAACEAVRYLNKVLSKHPRFHGQSPAEASEWAKTYMGQCNDDRILECCLGLADKMSPEKVILLTNDKNLMNKAMICDINVHSATSLMEKIKPDVIITSDSSKGRSKKNSFPGAFKSVSKNVSPRCKSDVPKDVINDTLLMNKRDSYKREIHNVMSNARQLLKDVLGQFLEIEMYKSYGEHWLKFRIERKLLKGILGGIKKYWGPVFSLFMSEKDKRNFEMLYEKACRPEGYLGDRDECLNILSVIEDIFLPIQRRQPSIFVPIESIKDFRLLCVETFLKHNNVEKSIQSAEHQNTLALFERDWTAINQLCGMILDFCEIPHEFQYEKPSIAPSEIEFRRLLCNLYPEVQQLKTHMAKMLEAVHTCKPTRNLFRRLYRSLLQFIPNLGIQYEPATFPHFSSRALENFCMSQENREMIEIGYKQIEQFYSKLDEAISVLMSTKFKKQSKSPDSMLCD